MKEDKDYTVLAEIGSVRPWKKIQLVRDKHFNRFSIMVWEKKPHPYIPFFEIKTSFWADMIYLGGKLQPNDSDFGDAFTKDIALLESIFEAWSELLNLNHNGSIKDMFQAINDDERDRYVI